MNFRSKAAVCGWVVFGAVAAQVGMADEPAVPSPLARMLQEHLGSWETTGYTLAGDQKTPVKARWSCQRAPEGPGLTCIWHHEWADGKRDTNLELIGWERQTGRLVMSRLSADGTLGSVEVDTDGVSMTRRWEFERDGARGEGVNHVVVKESGHWEQRVTMDAGGKRVFEMHLTQRRVAPAPGS